MAEASDSPGSAEALVQAARAGNREALNQLLEQAAKTAGALARAYARHRMDAEDILQESLLELSRGLATLQDTSSFGAKS